MSLPKNITDGFQKNGFAFVPSVTMHDILVPPKNDWELFADSWNDLKADIYMADNGRYRKRRYAVYAVQGGAITRQPHQAHFQTLDYNPLNGGVERWFEPMHDDVGNSESMQKILSFCCSTFSMFNPAAKKWHIETHQFRIEASAGEQGQPTPEGMHRDGRDYVAVLMIRRQNIKSGMTTIHDLNRTEIGSFTLTETFDAALVDDNRVFHGVTAVTPFDAAQPAYRDVLVVTGKSVTSLL